MSLSSRASSLAILLAVTLMSTAQADMTRKNPGINSTIVKASNQLAVGGGMLEQDYREFNDGLEPSLPAILDSESGRITSLRFSYTGMIHQLYVQANLNYSTGDTDYVGYLQSSGPPVTYTPFNTTTENRIVDVLARRLCVSGRRFGGVNSVWRSGQLHVAAGCGAFYPIRGHGRLFSYELQPRRQGPLQSHRASGT